MSLDVVHWRDADIEPLTHRAPPVSIDQTVSDFDGVIFHISTPESKTKIQVSIQIKCWKDLVNYGANEVLSREYGDYVVPAEPGYDFSILIDLENLPADKGMCEVVANEVTSIGSRY